MSAQAAPSLAMVSLGCAKNLVDTEELMGKIYDLNFNLVGDPESANAVIVNTCGFIQSAVDESLGSLREMVSLKKNGKVERVYAMGCYASRQDNVIREAVPGLDGAFSLSENDQLLDTLENNFKDELYVGKAKLAGIRPISATLPHYSFLKISEGCNRTCTYCTIPSIRGPNVDRSIEDLVEEAKGLVSRGVKELHIIAQDTTAYGIERYGRPRLLDLLKEIEKVQGLEWIRLLYAYPDYFSDDLADFILESPKMLNYLELPIQHASPSVLRRMSRADTYEKFDHVFDRLRKGDPEFALRTTVILGFPGESEEEFSFLLDYCRNRRFDRLGAFKYYREEGTPAYRMKDQVPEDVVEDRYHRLMSQQGEMHLVANEAWIGRDTSFIVDEVLEGQKFLGRTWRDAVDIDAQILIESSVPLEPGAIGTCRVTGYDDYDLLGVM
jgi:ribosomal protein S12 methylthiotransferase